MATFFTSDLHFSHAKICEYSNRPFASVQEMNEQLIRNWNETVTHEDDVYFLGDFLFGPNKEVEGPKILDQLMGRKFLVPGNHDRILFNFPDVFFKPGRFELCRDIYTAKAYLKNGQKRTYVLCHFPIQSWEGMHRGVQQLHGHCHATLQDSPLPRLDVGVDMRAKLYGMTPGSYRPFSVDEIETYMKTKKFEPVDHHRKGDY